MDMILIGNRTVGDHNRGGCSNLYTIVYSARGSKEDLEESEEELEEESEEDSEKDDSSAPIRAFIVEEMGKNFGPMATSDTILAEPAPCSSSTVR